MCGRAAEAKGEAAIRPSAGGGPEKEVAADSEVRFLRADQTRHPGRLLNQARSRPGRREWPRKEEGKGGLTNSIPRASRPLSNTLGNSHAKQGVFKRIQFQKRLLIIQKFQGFRRQKKQAKQPETQRNATRTKRWKLFETALTMKLFCTLISSDQFAHTQHQSWPKQADTLPGPGQPRAAKLGHTSRGQTKCSR